jgi:hypothetical protein
MSSMTQKLFRRKPVVEMEAETGSETGSPPSARLARSRNSRNARVRAAPDQRYRSALIRAASPPRW